jgi:hypothetical protein
VTGGGRGGSANAGMSSERRVGIPSAVCPRVPGEGSSAQGESGPKARPEGVVDGRPVDIPVLLGSRRRRSYPSQAAAVSFVGGGEAWGGWL